MVADLASLHSFRALALTSLGRIYAARGRDAEAVRDLTGALELWQELGDASKAAQAAAALRDLQEQRNADLTVSDR